ncbi:unnamed protein product [Rotaria sordida]|uniref:Uncharacterized protein n=1 Tax=Rotaria sordida TaxID=392033 RepID=A0A815GH59_9BILA|nr:unnamed protein product [Rotaria sordida]
MNVYHIETRNQFNTVLASLHEHVFSCSNGLGTKLSWNEQYLIESLSDSTIYMAYYTISHLLQARDSFNGKQLDLKKRFLFLIKYWFLFCSEKSYSLSSTDISHSTLDHLRNEFQYWYPINLYSSEKDLTSNHLIYSLCNHTAIWPNQPEYWPRSFRINGNLLLNSNTISESAGNFITLLEAIEQFSADGICLVLANAGDDSIENADFDENKAKELLLYLYTFIEWI